MCVCEGGEGEEGRKGGERVCVCVRGRGGGDLILTLHLATHSALEREPTMADILSHLSAVLAGYALKAFSRSCGQSR